MDYTFTITSANDGNAPEWRATYSNAIDAVNAFDKFIDYGTASHYRTINLYEPNGKCHTKNFYR